MPSGLVNIRESYSGMLCHPRSNFYRRIHLITPFALAALQTSGPLQQTVREFTSREVLRAAVFQATGLKPELFPGRGDLLTIGLRRTANAADDEIFEQAKEELCSQAAGLHRRVLFRMMGIDLPPEVDDLRPDRYATMLAKIFLIDPTLESIGEIRFSDHRLHDLGGGDVPRALVFSSLDLERGPQWSHFDKEAIKKRFIPAD